MNTSIKTFSLVLFLTMSSQTAFSAPNIKNDPVFVQSTIIGKVFHDRNGNRYQDSNEEGIPGVRLATVEGLVIETDGYGRFHIPDSEVGSVSLESNKRNNVLVKVDRASLPIGAIFTTENPRHLSASTNTLNSISFGVAF